MLAFAFLLVLSFFSLGNSAKSGITCGLLASQLNYTKVDNADIDFTVSLQNISCSVGQLCSNLKSKATVVGPNKVFTIKTGLGGCVNAHACGLYAGGPNNCSRSNILFNFTRYNCLGKKRDVLPMNLTFYARCCGTAACNRKDDVNMATCPLNNLRSKGLFALFYCAEKAKLFIKKAVCKAKADRGNVGTKRPKFCSKEIKSALRKFAACVCTPVTNSGGEEMLIVKHWFSYLWRDYCDIAFKCNAGGKFAILQKLKRSKITIKTTTMYSAEACKKLAETIAKNYKIPESAVNITCGAKKENGKYVNTVDVTTTDTPTNNYCTEEGISDCTVGAAATVEDTLTAETTTTTPAPSSASVPTLLFAVLLVLIMSFFTL